VVWYAAQRSWRYGQLSVLPIPRNDPDSSGQLRVVGRERIKTVTKPIPLELWDLPLSEGQTPHVVEKPKNGRDAMEPKEARCGLPTQEVTGSSPAAATINETQQSYHQAGEGSGRSPARPAIRRPGDFLARGASVTAPRGVVQSAARPIPRTVPGFSAFYDTGESAGILRLAVWVARTWLARIPAPGPR